MGTRTGVGGAVTIPAGFGVPVNLHIFEWRENRSRDVLDDTDFDTTDNAEEVIGGLESSTITVNARADRNDHPKMTSLANTVANTNEQPVAALVLREGLEGTASRQTSCSALLTVVSRGIIKGATVDYNLTFERSGISTDSEIDTEA